MVSYTCYVNGKRVSRNYYDKKIDGLNQLYYSVIFSWITDKNELPSIMRKTRKAIGYK